MQKDTDDETMKELIRLAYNWFVTFDVTCVACGDWRYKDPITGKFIKMGRSWLLKMLVDDISKMTTHDAEWVLRGAEWSVAHHGPIEGLLEVT